MINTLQQTLIHSTQIIRKSWWWWLISIFPPIVLAQTPALTFDKLVVGDAGQVVFTVFPSTMVHSNTLTNSGQYSYPTEDKRYIIAVSPDSITSSRFRSFTFEASVKQNGPNDVGWYVYTVRADPVGKFPDLLANVGFKIAAGKDVSIGSIRLPVHSALYDGDLIRKPGSSLATQVDVSDPQGPDIVIQNTLDNLDIHVTKIQVTKSQCYRCWEEGTSESRDIVIHPGATRSIPLNYVPKPLAAMFSTALILKKDAPQDNLSVTVSYNVDQGGMPKEKQLELPVRFTPSLWQLAIVVVGGGIVGAMLKRLIDHDVNKITARLVGQAVVFAVVAEIIAVLAVSFDSKIVILSFDLDPRQIVPAAVIAVAITGGQTVKQWMWQIIRPSGSAEARGQGSGGHS